MRPPVTRCAHSLSRRNLFQRGRLASLAQEELGKSRFLHEKRQQSIATGRNTPVEEIDAFWEDHELKQKYGQVSTLQQFQRDTGLGPLIQETMQHPSSSEAAMQARKELENVTERQRKRIPVERARLRERALYVDFDKDTHRWIRPKEEISREEARASIHHAVIDYAFQYDRLQNSLPDLQVIDAELFRALQAWAERPVLVEPPWPEIEFPM